MKKMDKYVIGNTALYVIGLYGVVVSIKNIAMHELLYQLEKNGVILTDITGNIVDVELPPIIPKFKKK